MSHYSSLFRRESIHVAIAALDCQCLDVAKISGDISYNGYKLKEFVLQRTAAYTSQNDLHIPEMIVRETLDFSSRWQGTGSSTCMTDHLHPRNKNRIVLYSIPSDDGLRTNSKSFNSLKRL
ncbi:hypothetical protein HanRHA438_Chr17g0815431 [Helianthus annuus]|nr:hypothetical protein HanHA89_Chr17g0708561 [Helianthus annuus]KAJ0632621.1 hypothetical protein HanLR1_Chr17g0667181 [Helianthus annuus]KAJ0826538.1 hypothetical protein HanRHA438_Chr17g0815431 [Helianthus annuus]